MEMDNKIKALLRASRWLWRSYKMTDSYLHRSGFFKSLELGQPARTTGEPAPWMNYSFVKFITPRIKGLRVLEYGSGYSTAYWATHASSVSAIEHDKEWSDKAAKQVESYQNATVAYIGEKKKYVHAVNDKADVVIVDGIHRSECLECAAQVIQDESVIVVDDSHRPSIDAAIQRVINEYGYKKIGISGFKPRDTGMFETAVLYKPKNVLGI